MRPIRLELSAFGPYLEHTVIDFEKLNEAGLFLITGQTGGGKTTLCNLIPRFYDTTAGSIRIDGKDIRTVTLKSLRDRIGFVQQDVYLFSGSVFENIQYGKPGASREEVIVASKMAGAHEFIEGLSNGYDTYVGERGVKLSGGQKRRVALAGVMAMDPQVLVLDEPRRGKEFFRTFDLPAYLRKHFNMFGGTEYRVTLRCAADLEPVMRERFGREPVFCPEEDGYFHFDVPICVSPQFFGWVCGFGGKVEVTAPAAVRAQLHEMVQSLAEQHE